MKSRERKIRRILAVQTKLHRIAEWNLLEVQAREHQIEQRQQRIIEGFNEESPLPDRMLQTAGRNLKAASVELGGVAKKKERLAQHALAEGRKLKQLLRMARTAAGRVFREEEKRMLEDATDAAAARASRGSMEQ